MPDPFLHDGNYPRPVPATELATHDQEDPRGIRVMVENLLYEPAVTVERLPNYNRLDPVGVETDPSEAVVFTRGMATTEMTDQRNGRVQHDVLAFIESGSEIFGIFTLSKWHKGDQNSRQVIDLSDINQLARRVVDQDETDAEERGGWSDSVDIVVRYSGDGSTELVGILQVDPRHRNRYDIFVDGSARADNDPHVRFKVEKPNESRVVITDLPSPNDTVVMYRQVETGPETPPHRVSPSSQLDARPEAWRVDSDTVSRAFEIQHRIADRH